MLNETYQLIIVKLICTSMREYNFKDSLQNLPKPHAISLVYILFGLSSINIRFSYSHKFSGLQDQPHDRIKPKEWQFRRQCSCDIASIRIRNSRQNHTTI